MIKEIFQTERLIVREFELTDVIDMFDMYSRPEVVRFLKRDPAVDLDEVLLSLEERIASYIGTPFGAWAAWHKVDKKVIGLAILKPLPADSRVEVGWHLHPEYWGSGFATEMGKGAIRHGFEALELHEVFAILLAENKASWRVAERCGLSHIGQTDRYHELTLEFFRISREEWDARR